MSTEPFPEVVREHDSQIDQHIIDVREKLKAGTKFLLYSDVTRMISEILMLRQQRDEPSRWEAAAQQERARLADYITEDLFTNGSGERADRLVLTIDGPPKRDLGGWGKLPFADRLRDLLASHSPPTPEATQTHTDDCVSWLGRACDCQPRVRKPPPTPEDR